MESKPAFQPEVLGAGQYGSVKTNEDGNAIKTMECSTKDLGMDSSALREIAILSKMGNCPQIVKLLQFNVVEEKDLKDSVSVANLVSVAKDPMSYAKSEIVMPRYKHSLRDILTHFYTNGGHMFLFDVKMVAYQILLALRFCEQSGIYHRDVKPENILLNGYEDVVLADFGISRSVHASGTDLPFTGNIQTIPYRSPEVLLGDVRYSVKIDVWSMGCILLEMLRGQPLFWAIHEIVQLFKIFNKLGTPTDGELTKLPNFKTTFPKFEAQPDCLTTRDQEANDLVTKMLQLNPQDRISFQECLDHGFFDSVRTLFPVSEPCVTVPVSVRKSYYPSSRKMIMEEMYHCLHDVSIDLDLTSYFLACRYLDRYLDTCLGPKRAPNEVVALACLSLACKLNECQSDYIGAFAHVARSTEDGRAKLIAELVWMELLVFKALGSEMLVPTLYSQVAQLYNGRKMCEAALRCVFLLNLSQNTDVTAEHVFNNPHMLLDSMEISSIINLDSSTSKCFAC